MKINQLDFSVRAKGLEPPRLTAPDPKSGAATNYATRAMLWVSECKGRQKNGTTKLLLQIYPKRYTESLPKAFLTKYTIAQEQAKITIAENGMRRGAGIWNHSPIAYPKQTK